MWLVPRQGVPSQLAALVSHSAVVVVVVVAVAVVVTVVVVIVVVCIYRMSSARF